MRLVPPEWEAELGRILDEAPGLPAAARRAVAQVVESLIAESGVDAGEAVSARPLLDALAGREQSGPPRVMRAA